MTPDQQIMFNLVMTVAVFFAGWFFRILWARIQELRDDHKSLIDSHLDHQMQMSAIRELVAGSYATREELGKMSEALFRKLDRIENKLDDKADKTPTV